MQQNKAVIESAFGGPIKLRQALLAALRTALDEVIDTLRTGRRSVNELNEIETVYIGSKIEALIQHQLRTARNCNGVAINGINVAAVFTLSDEWSSPHSQEPNVFIVVFYDRFSSNCSFGLINSSDDGKIDNVTWLIKDEELARNFWESVSAETIDAIFSKKSGNQRLQYLFSNLLETPISRDVVATVAQQKDYMKRVRKNGGARDALARNEIAILNGEVDSEIIRELGLSPISKDQFYSYKCKSDADRILLISNGKIE